MRKVLKKIIPKRVVKTVFTIRDKLQEKLANLASNARITTKFYYAFASNQFSREQHAVLMGRIAFINGKATADVQSAQLRRNIHRIEKGLIMRPRRDVFAEAYISQTVNKLKICVRDSFTTEAELKWAVDVLDEYFSCVSLTSTITAAKLQFEKLSLQASAVERSVPYFRENSTFSTVEYDEFFALCRQRRSVRWYEQKPVPQSLLEKAIDAAAQAPSACNRQPFQFYVFNDSESAYKVGSIAGGTAGFANNFPCLIAVVGDLSAYPYERDRHVFYIDASLASMQLMLALETLGLSSCAINWPDVEAKEKKISELLKLEKFQRVVMLISIGYADTKGMIPFSEKKSSSSLAKFITL
jgi:nitroreductase